MLWRTAASTGLILFSTSGLAAGQSAPECPGFGGPLLLALDLSYDPSDPVVGTFCMEGTDGGDPREGGTASLVTDSAITTGSLSGVSTKVNEVRRVDPVTGRPIGEEPAGNLGIFLSLDYATTGFSDFDPSFGALRIFNSQNKTGSPSVTIAAASANLLAGDPTGLVFGAFLGVPIPGGPCDSGDIASNRLCNPLVQLSNDAPFDGPPLTFGEALAAGLTPTPIDGAIMYASGLQALLSDEQQALLGCGPFYGTFCDGHGTDSFNMEVSALLLSLLEPSHGFFGDDTSVPQPGPVGFQGEPVCTRLENGETFTLPGCRGPGDPGYDPNVDGTTTGPGPIVGAYRRFQPFTSSTPTVPQPQSQFFKNEMAVLSWNAIMSFVAYSAPPDMVDTDGDGIPDQPTDLNGDGWPDSQFIAQDEFDITAPFRKTGCSLIFPSACFGVRNLTSVTTRELPNDPSGPPKLRWVWETGVEYEITDASGDLVDFLGPPPWVLHAGAVEFPVVPPGFEPPGLQTAQAIAPSPTLFGMGVLLEPPDPTGDPCLPTFPIPDSPLIVPSPLGCPAIGSAFAVPEPSSALQGFVALGGVLLLGVGRGVHHGRRQRGRARAAGKSVLQIAE
jgi:hypothetical protein